MCIRYAHVWLSKCTVLIYVATVTQKSSWGSLFRQQSHWRAVRDFSSVQQVARYILHSQPVHSRANHVSRSLTFTCCVSPTISPTSWLIPFDDHLHPLYTPPTPPPPPTGSTMGAPSLSATLPMFTTAGVSNMSLHLLASVASAACTGSTPSASHPGIQTPASWANHLGPLQPRCSPPS